MKKTDGKETSIKILDKTGEAGKISLFYGFLPIESPNIAKGYQDTIRDTDASMHPAEKVSILKEFSELRGNHLPQPLMLFLEKPFPGSPERKRPHRVECELVILGSQKSICECLLLQTTKAILEGAGWKDLFVKINSLGGKESVAEYERKMSAFVRKRMDDFPAELRQNLKKDLFYNYFSSKIFLI
jgi:hypothetical protein